MMTTTLQFRIQNLLSMKDGKVTGAMSPLLFAKEMAALTQTKFNRLARVWFNDEKVFQMEEDGGLTGFDHLIIGTQYNNNLRLSLWIDEGVSGVPVATVFQSDKDIVLTSAYKKRQYARKLNEDELKEVFDFLFNNTHLLDIPEEPNPIQTSDNN